MSPAATQPHPPCVTIWGMEDDVPVGCGHAWNLHAPTTAEGGAAHCRVTGCGCLQYRDKEPVEPMLSRSETMVEVANRIEAGEIVVALPVKVGVDRAQLVVLRYLIGTPLDIDPDVAVLVVNR